jgi:hypothetical protein
MKSAKTTTNSKSVNDPRRCQHRTTSGRRCRLAIVDSHSGLCYRHAEKQSEAFHASDLRATLAGEMTQFEDAEQINKFLCNLLLLLAEDRVSTRRASVMAYTCNLLLRTISVHIQELRVDSNDEPVVPTIDFGDLPRPNRNVPAADSTGSSHPS